MRPRRAHAYALLHRVRMTSTEVLHERVSAHDHACSVIALSPRIGRNRELEPVGAENSSGPVTWGLADVIWVSRCRPSAPSLPGPVGAAHS